jgi:hypothetical protein
MPRQLPLAARRRPDIAPEDVGTLLLHSLRYSVGRRSTAPSTTRHALLAWMLAAERPASDEVAAWAELAGLDPDMAAAVRRLL